MKTAVKWLAVAAVAWVLMRSVSRPVLKHFKPIEFGVWWPFMSADLLRKVDAFREGWGYPVVISKAAGSLGRHGGTGDDSQHNVDKYGEVRAVDTFPMVPDGNGGFRYMRTARERQRALTVAQQVGFTGIGLYTDTKPGNLLHVDVRIADKVALWSRIDGEYLGINEVLV